MLIEIPEPDVILGVIVAFVIGLVALYSYYKIRPFIKSKSEMIDSSQLERLEYYEKQLIDMKIRLDSMEMQGVEQKNEDPNLEIKQFLEKLSKNQQVIENPIISPKTAEIMNKEESGTNRMPNLDHNNATDYVLHLITDKAMTSRDIQITLKRSREHTSRLMKKLFDDGYVKRNTSTKPYTYSITEKGKEKINVLQSSSLIV
ncbi:MAG: MarR family transcriptional regulator [Nitrosopumilales archaeon CG_4_10_14_0_8_um_filter_34_8]|jgi:predicted HTH transcriptional regulator|nr:MAG: MarR family transcriptional regulator [Nitrosopumilales archaeon CG_4_10_14_0_8_um_filter_34_8]PJB96311.1 MAG: MarR family transcriptional regulator [Nitrosopumilales archaeon CG_4_9_14_0_8_um_filter_34_10]